MKFHFDSSQHLVWIFNSLPAIKRKQLGYIRTAIDYLNGLSARESGIKKLEASKNRQSVRHPDNYDVLLQSSQPRYKTTPPRPVYPPLKVQSFFSLHSARAANPENLHASHTFMPALNAGNTPSIVPLSSLPRTLLLFQEPVSNTSPVNPELAFDQSPNFAILLNTPSAT